ncbi:unnamed protein product, partial [Phaeothamnion confervicola]
LSSSACRPRTPRSASQRKMAVVPLQQHMEPTGQHLRRRVKSEMTVVRGAAADITLTTSWP